MSPSEDDLRAALRAGEGDPVSAALIMSLADRRRAQHRVRALSAAATVVVVGGLAGGIYVARNANDQGTAASSNSAATDDLNPPHGAAASRVPAAPSSTRTPCPATPTRVQLPGGGSAGQFGSDGPLFPKPVSTVYVCGYETPPNSTSSTTGDTTLRGAAALQLVSSLEDAPKSKPVGACPLYRPAIARTVTVLGVTADGKQLRPVTFDVGLPTCAVVITNGTAVRYAWSPPPALANALGRVVPGLESGSPLHS